MIISKPDNSQFFAEHEPEKHKEYINWVKTCKGFVSFTDENLTTTVKEQIIMFDNEENYANFLKESSNNKIVNERLIYNVSHGIEVDKEVSTI
jgi:hypothetical protein